MTNVSPSNLKLIGRATYLIQSHVNDILQKSNAINSGLTSISYAEANAVLFDSINFLKNSDESKQIAEVAFSIIRILESLSFGKPISYEEVIKILKESDLNRYLFSCYAKR
jgi:hypothetical protein